MSPVNLERIAVVAAVLVLVGGVWFWWLQVQDVMELLEMAYGE